MAFPRKGFVFLILLGLGDQENVAVFPELLQGCRRGGWGWEACLGSSIWTENSLWSVARGDFLLGECREHYHWWGGLASSLSLPGICLVTLSKGPHPF